MQTTFYLHESKGVHYVYLRISFDNRRIRFSTGRSVKLSDWDQNRNCLRKRAAHSVRINHELKNLEAEAINIYETARFHKEHMSNKEFVSRLKAFIGRVEVVDDEDKEEKNRVLYWIDEFTEAYRHTKSANYIRRFRSLKRDIKLFDSNLLLTECNEKKIMEFANVLFDRGLKNNTVSGRIRLMNRILNFAESHECYVPKSFRNAKVSYINADIVYLTPDELKKAEQITGLTNSLELILDMFLFSCYTGLRFSDLEALEKKHILYESRYWLRLRMQKTNTLVRIPLVDKAKGIVDKHRNESEKIFSYISLQNYNVYLKAILNSAGIKKANSVSSHTGRHTFATLFILKGGKVTVLQKLLGHADIRSTMQYYEILDIQLESSLDGMF